MNKKWVTIAALGAVLIGGGVWAYKHFTTKTTTSTLITSQVKIGNVQKVITATGSVNYPNPVALSFNLGSNQGGKLVALNVNPGDKVTKGQVLAQLDTSDLQTALQSAQASLLLAQARYQQTLDSEQSTLLSAVSTAQQTLNTALQTVATAQQNADPGYLANQVNLAQQNLLTASNTLASTQAKAAQTGNTSGVQAAQTAVTTAQTALATAQYQQNGGAAQTLNQAQIAVNVAQANLAQAQDQWQKYKDGQQATDLLSAESTLSSAQNQLASAQKNLDNAQLVAPDDGVAITVPVKNYQTVSANATILTLAVGNDNMEVDASVDQSDINQVSVGQKVDVTLDSQPNQHMSGTIMQVALQGTTASNVTTYNVKIIMDTATPLLKAGMNANVSVILAEAKNVLTIPSEAVHTFGDRTMVMVPGAAAADSNSGNGSSDSSGSAQNTQSNKQNTGTNGNTSGNSSNRTGSSSSSQNKTGSSRTGGTNLTGVNAHYVPVVIGLDDGSNVEIKSGLTEGQEIVTSVRTTSTTSSSSSSSSSNSSNNNNNANRAMMQVNRAASGH